MSEAGVRFAASGWGVDVAVECAPAAATDLRARLPFWWWEPAAADAGGSSTDPDGAARPAPRTWRVETPEQVPGVVAEVELWVAEHAAGAVFVHAGVVMGLGRRALLLPGFSLAGKSTLVTALLAAGARFGSDEYALLDAGGRVARYPRPISRRDPARRVPVEPDRWLPPDAPVGAVAFTCFDSALDSAAAPRVRDLTPGEATLRLLEHAVAARSRPVACLAAATAVTARARCVEVVRGEAPTAVAALLALT